MYFSTFSGIKYLTELPLFNWSLMYVEEISKDGTYTLIMFALYFVSSFSICSCALSRLIPGLVAAINVANLKFSSTSFHSSISHIASAPVIKKNCAPG